MRQTLAQALGRKGERWFQNAIPKEWIFQRPTEDFVLDGTVMLATANELSGIEFGVQVKTSAKWVAQGGFFVVSGIPYRTLMRWVSPFLPTLLVLYDDSRERGYYAWVQDVLKEIGEVEQLILNHPKTLTLKVPAESYLEPPCWDGIQAWLYEHHSLIIRAIETKNITATILPTIHQLTHALQFLLMLQAGMPPQNEEEENLQCLTDFTAHKIAVNALHTLESHRYANSPFTSKKLVDYVRTFLRAYLVRLELFLTTDALFHEEAAASWVNRGQMIRLRPELLYMLTQCIAVLSGVMRTPACDVCSKDPGVDPENTVASLSSR